MHKCKDVNICASMFLGSLSLTSLVCVEADEAQVSLSPILSSAELVSLCLGASLKHSFYFNICRLRHDLSDVNTSAILSVVLTERGVERRSFRHDIRPSLLHRLCLLTVFSTLVIKHVSSTHFIHQHCDK